MHSLFQKIIPMPYAVDFPNSQIIKCANHQKSFHKVFRILVLLAIILLFVPFCFGRFIWLLHHWKSYTVYCVDQIIVYMFYLTAAFLFTQKGKCDTVQIKSTLQTNTSFS